MNKGSKEREHEEEKASDKVLTKVPVRNLYYLLCYAWNYTRQGRPVPMPEGSCENLANLFALLLTRGIQQEVKRGIHREYLVHSGETAKLRGRLGIRESLQRQTWNQGRMVCHSDELSHDVLPNQILLASGKRLLRDLTLTSRNRSALGEQLDWFHDVTPIHISAGDFRRVQVQPRNRTYRFLLRLCELLHKHHLPGEGTDSGDRTLRSILEDEISLCHLFEEFVRNFLDLHLGDCQVNANRIQWDGGGLDTSSEAHLPRLLTDVTIDGPGKRIILDCKFYRYALKGGQKRDKVISAHLYQLLAYLQNARETFRDWNTGVRPLGILLYPAVERSFDLHFELLKYPLRVCTVDLNREWQEIESGLMKVVAEKGALRE